ncbi:MAG: ABC transporter permease [bacterium]|nr:ABC transporter permease [bacterium]
MSIFSENIRSNARVFMALLHRDLKMFKQKFRSVFIDSICVLLVEIVLFNNLLPHFGMPREIIAPAYLGSVVGFLFFLGYSQATRLVFDIEYDRFIDYHLSLPLSIYWLFTEYVTFLIIESLTITLPLVTLGIILLGDNFRMVTPNFGLFILMYLLMLIFFALLFAWISFHYNADFFYNHLWPRRLSPFFNVSAIFFSWKGIYTLSPTISYLLLANPITYLAEGLRATLLNKDDYLSIYLCFGVMIIFTLPLFFLLARSIKKRLDPV